VSWFALNCFVVISSRSCFFHVRCDSTVCLHGPALTASSIRSLGSGGSSPMSIIWKLSRAARDSLSGRVGLFRAHCRDPMCSVSSLCSVLWCRGSFSTAFFVDYTFKRFRNTSWRAVRREMTPCLDDTSGSASMPSAIGVHS
jgi:hypothetical protein